MIQLKLDLQKVISQYSMYTLSSKLLLSTAQNMRCPHCAPKSARLARFYNYSNRPRSENTEIIALSTFGQSRWESANVWLVAVPFAPTSSGGRET